MAELPRDLEDAVPRMEDAVRFARGTDGVVRALRTRVADAGDGLPAAVAFC